MKRIFSLSPILIFTLMSCGQAMKSSRSSEKSPIIEEGNYRSIVLPLNRQFQKTSITGEVSTTVEATKLKIKVDLKDLSSSMMHPQYLHYGASCPTERDDSNGDGVIDVTEAKKAMGEEIISLIDKEKNLNESQFPSTNSEGELFYLKTISSEEMKKYFIKLFPQKWTHMSYLILGIGDDVELPESVKGISGLKIQTTLPVGCGTFEKIQFESSSTDVNGGKN